MNVSLLGIAFIQSYEAFRAMAYTDQAGNPTIGYGHLIIPTDPDYSNGLTPDQASALFASDLATIAEQPVNAALTIDVSQQQFDALCSLCYNIGNGAFDGCHALQLLNAGTDPSLVAPAFLNWDHVRENGAETVSAGLLRRRQAEVNIFLNGIYLNNI